MIVNLLVAKSTGLRPRSKLLTSPSPRLTRACGWDNVEVVESFTYLRVDIHNSGSSEHDIRKRVAIARNCMASLDRNIWHSFISLPTKLRLYRVFFLMMMRPVTSGITILRGRGTARVDGKQISLPKINNEQIMIRNIPTA